LSRRLTIYQTYSGEDMAGSDSFHPTLARARAWLREAYGIKGPIELDGGSWEGQGNGDWGGDVHLERHEITVSREGLCSALEGIPCR
jgi:hypothetical protein